MTDQIIDGKPVIGTDILSFPTDSANFDAFDRLRVSSPATIFDSKQVNDNLPRLWDDQEVSGSGTTSSHSVNTASTTLGVSATTIGKRVRQTFQCFNYQPGKSHLFFMTFVLDKTGGGAGIIREVGPMNDSNGLFLRDNEGTIQFVRRTYVTGSAADNTVNQADWNVDKMDGTGISGITLDCSKTQILIIDFEWLGVGRVRMGFITDGIIYYAHQFLNANVLDEVYMSTPNLPLRYSIENDGSGAASTLQQICCSVISEGGVQRTGTMHYASTGGTHVDCSTQNVIYAILGIRLKSTHLCTSIELGNLHLQEQSGSKQMEWLLLINPTVAGTFTYSDHDDSAVQIATGATANTVTGGHELSGGFFSSTNKGGEDAQDIDNAIKLGAAIDGTVDEIILCVRPVGGSANIDIEGGLQWRELS